MHHSLSLLLVIIGLQVSVQSTGRRSEFRSVLTVPNGMKLGSWGYLDLCPNGTYAAGFSLKVDEPSYGFWADNKGLTGIRLHCISLSNVLKGSFEDYTSVQSEVGSWGWWTDIKWCPCGFLTAFQLRVESSQLFGDDTAANNIMFRCTQEYLYGDGTLWASGATGLKCVGEQGFVVLRHGLKSHRDLETTPLSMMCACSAVIKV